MSFYNPDQYTEPQSGLQPERTFDELYDLFMAQMRARYSAFSQEKVNLKLWEQFKKELT